MICLGINLLRMASLLLANKNSVREGREVPEVRFLFQYLPKPRVQNTLQISARWAPPSRGVETEGKSEGGMGRWLLEVSPLTKPCFSTCLLSLPT